MAGDSTNTNTLDGFSSPVPYRTDAIAAVDDRQGVHVVSGPSNDVIFVGRSAKTRTRLRQHLTGDRGASVLHKQVGEVLDAELGRQASKDEIREWLEKCTVAWKYDDNPAPLKARIMDELSPRFNTVYPTTDTEPEQRAAIPNPEDGYMDENELIRLTLDSIVDEYRATGLKEEFATSNAWSQNSDALQQAMDRLRNSDDLKQFARDLPGLPNLPGWLRQGALRTFIGTLADRASDPEAAAIVARAFSVPADEREAELKITELVEMAEGVENLYPGPGFAPLAASAMWCMVDPDNWPWLSAEAEPVLHILRLLPRYLPGAGRYLAYRDVVLMASSSAPETTFALAKAGERGSRSVSSGIYQRLKENSELLKAWYESEAYPSEEASKRAARNIEAVLGEFDLFAKGMNEVIAERLVRELVTSKTDPRVAFEMHMPSRADGYAIFTIEKNMTMPSIRVWATPSGLAVGAHFGSQKAYAESMEAAEKLVEDLPPDMEFFSVQPHREGDRLRPAGREPIRGELFVGRWFEGGLTGPEVGEKTIEVVGELQSTFDRMVRSVGELPSTAEAADDELSELYEKFISVTGYPTEADRTNKSEREQMAEVLSEEGLLAFDVHEFRRIFNTARYGSPGPQSILNASLSQMSAEELDLFANNVEFLLRGSMPLPDRIDALMPTGDRGVRGFGEAVITKLLAIDRPDEIIPIFVYRGPKGKGRMLSLLELREPELDTAEVGERLIRSNEILRNRLAPLFGEDMLGMSRFLYWLSERDPDVDQGDETDHIGNLADTVLVDREFLDELAHLLGDKGQLIFYGPPGTGKTFLARELVKALAPDPAQRMLVQFHPSTSYEDFFEGFRPETDAQGRLTYRLVKGPLILLADRARDNPSKNYMLVIDEINRANLPKVFGELLFLLEYRDESIRSLYRPDEPFELPKNLHIVGTMNTADRSIALIDAAMRRRFHFIPFFPNEGPMADLLSRWLAAHDEPDWVSALLNMVNDELRERLGGPHLQIGPSHFMRAGIGKDGDLERIWTYSVYPYIEEQLYGDQGAINQFTYESVRKRFDQKFAPAEAAEEDNDDDSPPGME